MHSDATKLLKLMFNPSETICLSPNQFGYQSLPIEQVLESASIPLVPTPESVEKINEWREGKGYAPKTLEQSIEQCPTDTLQLVALNPVNGYRTDSNVYKYRSFMVEMDTGTGTAEDLQSQATHIKNYDLPFSACIFSGGKSLHYLITLDEDIETEEEWRHLAEWILAAIPLADQMTKNPTRSIRVPGAYRTEKKKFQKLIKIGERISKDTLMAWLRRFPGDEPKKYVREYRSDTPQFSLIKPWVLKLLNDGLNPNRGRSNQWYSISYEFALRGYSEFDTIELLSAYFVESKTFKRKELLTAIKSAFKIVKENR